MENTRTIQVIDFILNNYGIEIQLFDTRNICGDETGCVYDENGISIDYCSDWDYLEIFGLTQEEKEILQKIFKNAEF